VRRLKPVAAPGEVDFVRRDAAFLMLSVAASHFADLAWSRNAAFA